MRRRGSIGARDTNRSSVSTVEDEGNAALPEPLLEQPKGAPPLSELSVDSLALVVDGPSLVSSLFFSLPSFPRAFDPETVVRGGKNRSEMNEKNQMCVTKNSL